MTSLQKLIGVSLLIISLSFAFYFIFFLPYIKLREENYTKQYRSLCSKNLTGYKSSVQRKMLENKNYNEIPKRVWNEFYRDCLAKYGLKPEDIY